MLLEEKTNPLLGEIMNFTNPTKQYAPRPMRASDCANLKQHSDLGQGNWQGRRFSSILENQIR